MGLKFINKYLNFHYAQLPSTHTNSLVIFVLPFELSICLIFLPVPSLFFSDYFFLRNKKITPFGVSTECEKVLMGKKEEKYIYDPTLSHVLL